MVQASSINSVDTTKLAVLMQNAQGFDEGDDSDAVGAHVAAYHSHCGSTVEDSGGLKAALGELAASQVAMTKLRAKKKDAFAKNKQDLEDGIDGVRTALGVSGGWTFRRADTEMVRGEVKRVTKISRRTQRASGGHVHGGNDVGTYYWEVKNSWGTSGGERGHEFGV